MKNLYKALADFQKEVPVILKETSGHNYKYADLPAIDEVIKPLLEKHGLGVVQPLSYIETSEKPVPAITTMIFHVESGERTESVHPLPNLGLGKITTKKTDKKTGNTAESEKFVVKGMEQMSLPQANGSMITYYRRYCLASFLGLITDKDNDGAGNKGAEHDLF